MTFILTLLASIALATASYFIGRQDGYDKYVKRSLYDREMEIADLSKRLHEAESA